jgi:hypothetical protein
MRLILERDGHCVSVFWIRRRRNDIIGWFTTRASEGSFAPRSAQERVDVHFRYPADGNIHFSFKYYDTGSCLKRVESYYFDRVRQKTFDDGQAHISEIPREEWELRSDRGLFVPKYRPMPLHEYATTSNMFFFPTTGFNVFPNQAPSIFNTDETAPRPNDFIVSIDRPNAVNVNFSACLLGRDANTNSWNIEPNQERFHMQDDSAYPIIKLWTLVAPCT